MTTYAVAKPRSAILTSGCTRSWARDHVARGYFPRGSIWFPGSVRGRPDLGDLFAPDPDWRGATPILPAPELER